MSSTTVEVEKPPQARRMKLDMSLQTACYLRKLLCDQPISDAQAVVLYRVINDGIGEISPALRQAA